MSEQRFFIASLKHTHDHCEHIVWWATNHRGYTPVLGDNVGRYTLDDARKLNDGYDYIAVPVEAVTGLWIEQPEWKPGARYYDQPGPVVDNTRKNWNALVAAAIAEGRPDTFKPRPTVYRRKRRA